MSRKSAGDGRGPKGSVRVGTAKLDLRARGGLVSGALGVALVLVYERAVRRKSQVLGARDFREQTQLPRRRARPPWSAGAALEIGWMIEVGDEPRLLRPPGQM